MLPRQARDKHSESIQEKRYVFLQDVDFLAALIERLIQQYKIPPAQEGGKILMSGMSNGGSMAFRFNCEKAEMIGGKKPAPFSSTLLFYARMII
eukprot:COSAG06_NODE_7178_length_2597_cov_1.973579_2_plen_94_part_00